MTTYEDYFRYFSTQPAAPTTAQLLTALAAAPSGGYALISCLYIFATDTQAHALKNLTLKGSTDFTNQNSVAFTPNVGFTGNGTNSFLQGPTFTTITGLSPSFAQNSASFCMWSMTDIEGANQAVATDTAGQAFLNLPSDASKNASVRANASTQDSLPGKGGIGAVGFVRNNSSTFRGFVNGQMGTYTRTSTGIPSAAHLTVFKAGTSTFSTHTIGALFLGAAMTDAQYYEQVAIITAYLEAINAFNRDKPGFAWGADGVWTWFNDPRVIIANSKPVYGALSETGFSQVVQDQASGLKNIVPLINFGPDDHSNPAFIVRASDSKILAFYSQHNAGNANYYMAVSTAANDPTTFATPVNIGTTYFAGTYSAFAYANPYQLSGESNAIYLFFRSEAGGTFTVYYSKSTDGGATWAAPTQLAWGVRPYFKGVQNGANRIDFCLSAGNPGDLYPSACSIYHGYYQGSAFYNSAGVSKSLPLAQTDPTKVYDSTATGYLAWNWDIQIDSNNNPVILFAEFHPGPAGEQGQSHWYYQARWNGTAWTYYKICEAGGSLYKSGFITEPYYSGGMCIDTGNVGSVVYASRQVDVNGNISLTGTFQLFKFTSADGGITWDGGTQITHGQVDCFRPYVPAGARTLFYCVGPYTTYTNYSGNVRSMAIT